MKLKTILKYLFNRKSIKEPKKVNAETIKYFIQGNVRKMANIFGIVDKHIVEQAAWREGQVKEKQPICFRLQKCQFCECGLPELVFSDNPCEHGCYPKLMNENQWNEFKKQNNITIDNATNTGNN